MNDQLLMDEYLLILKSTVEVYVHGTLESSNKDIETTLKECLDEIMTSQSNAYKKMTEFGWYQINNIDKNTINQTLTKVQSSN